MSLQVQQRETVTALLERSGRQAVPLRRSFTQLRSKGGGAGPLSLFVSQRRRRALDLYLLAHAAASSEPWDVALPATVWARMLGLQGRGALSAVSRQWTWLERQRLISTHRHDAMRKITLLREDGSGAPYSHPGVADDGERPEGDYFTLPYAYWQLGLPDRIDLPTKAVLLIALSRPDDFILPLEHAAKWYAISPDSLRTGLRLLQTLGFLERRVLRESAPLTAAGFREERRYTLRPPFGPRTQEIGRPRRSKSQEVRHVMANPKGGWEVKKPGASRPSARLPTRRDAEERAVKILRNVGGGELILHRRDGAIRSKTAIGTDDLPPR